MATNINTSYSAASMKRLTGLVSGLDVDALVQQMVTGQQSRLDKANQQKQLIEWQKDAYRSVVTKISDFQTKHLDILNSNSILRTSAFKSSTATVPSSMSKYVSVSSATDSVPNPITIDEITSLATAQKIESNGGLSKAITMSLSEASVSSGFEDALGGVFSITLDGVTKTIELSSDISDYESVDGSFDPRKIMEDLNEQLEAAFGKSNGVAKVKFDIQLTELQDEYGNISDNIYDFTLDVVDGSYAKVSGSELGSAISFVNGQSNYLDTEKSVGELFGNGGFDGGLESNEDDRIKFSINGVEFEFSETAKMKDVINAINTSSAGVTASYSSLTDKFVLTSDTMGTGNNIVLEDLDGTNFFASVLGDNNALSDVDDYDDYDNYNDDDDDTTIQSKPDFGSVTDGKDAVLMVNGNKIIRSSNTFTIEGVRVELLSITPGEADFEGIPVSGSTDTTQAIENIKEFVNSYNELIGFLNSVVGEEKQKGYSPLTDAQKAEMSDRDIEGWENAAKSGLLRGDTVISRIINEMRTAMVSMVSPKGSDGKLSLTSIGISSSSSTTGITSGTLTIDEEKLKAAIESDPEALVKLFTQGSDIPQGQTLNSSYTAQGYTTQTELNTARYNSLGLAQRITEIFTAAVGTSYSSTGSLIKIAGTGGKNPAVDYQSSLSEKLTSIDKTIKQLQNKLYDAEDRAYLKMSKLETALSSLNSQSSYLFNNS